MMARAGLDPQPLDEKDVKAIVEAQVKAARSHADDISNDRGRALDLYYGRAVGDLRSVKGRSGVVSTDVQDVIESVMPDLMQIFGASDALARFEPKTEDDKDDAEQATDYINHVFHNDNDGWLILHDLFKDALLEKNGFVKAWWDETEETEVREHTGLSGDQLAIVATARGDDEEITVEEHTARFNDDAAATLAEIGETLGVDLSDVKPADFAEDMAVLVNMGVPAEVLQGIDDAILVHDVKIRRTVMKRRIHVANVPPEEFLISPGARTLEDAALVGQRTHKTVSELIEMGFDKETIYGIPSGDGDRFNIERSRRTDRASERPIFDDETDASMREIEVFELYMRIDQDGDGIAELREIVAAGPQFEILSNDEVAEQPFETVTPVRMPHKFFGRSLADLTEDIEKIKTAIWRQLLDNMYNVNNARPIISKKVTVEDVISNRVGAPVRVKADSVAGHIDYMQTVPIGQHGFPLLEYVDTVRETRTGVNRLGQGVDPDALDSTAGGINMLLGRAAQRVLMMAQMFAHMGVKPLAKKMLRLAVRHQDRPRIIRLRNDFVEMDPRVWNTDMDVSVDVGLGHGTQQQQTIAMQMFMAIMEKIIALQGGANGPLVEMKHIRDAAAKMGETMGLKTIDPFMNEIDDEQQRAIANQPPPPDPKMEEIKAEDARAREEMKLRDDRETLDIMLKHKREMMAEGNDAEAREMQMQIDAVLKLREQNLKRNTDEADLAQKAAKAAGELDIKGFQTAGQMTIQKAAANARGQTSP